MCASAGMACVKELATRHDGATVVLVGHTVINRAILLEVLDAGDDAFWRLGQEPCCINVFESGGPGWVVNLLNDTCHLPVGG